MGKLLAALVVVVLIIGAPMAGAVRRLCVRVPRYRGWLMAGAAVLLVGVGFAAPRLDNVIPQGMRESPAGLIPFFAAAAGLSVIALLALAVLAGALLSFRSAHHEPIA